MLQVSDLFHSYREGESERVIFRAASLALAAGESVALIGASGSGKSTLLNLVGGIDTPLSGRVQISGTDISALGEPARTEFRRQHLGFVYQRFHLIPTLTAAENIALPLALLGVAAGEQRRRVADWLDAVGLTGRGDSFPDRLSGGEQQRIAIARALVHGPRLLLADEPTGSLDPVTGQQVLDLLFDRGPAGERALLLVTHSLEVARRADRVLRLADGGMHAAQVSSG
jgi:putative ABC transport system ATP-binding protein